MKVGLVGLGRMGAAIGQRLNERGCEVVAWDRDPKARELQGKRGLRVVNGPQAVADEAEVVLSIITEDKGVRQIFTAPDGFLSGEVKGKLFVEMSTLQPMTHRELAPMVKAKGVSISTRASHFAGVLAAAAPELPPADAFSVLLRICNPKAVAVHAG